MIRTTFPGGWYGDATPGGAYAVLFANSHVQTHQGPIPLPASQPLQSPLFLRVTDVGGFRCAGQSSSVEVPAAWEWTGASWRALPPPCVGVSPLIYDLLGILHTSDGSIGSQGWRYCAQDGSGTGRLITGDQTYGPTSPIAVQYGVQGLFEYSPAGPDLWVGQAAYDGGGVQVWDGTTLRQLERGDCRFVRVQWAGEQVAITFTTPPQTVLIQTTLAELRALPPVEAPEPPEPTPEPPEPPDPPVPPEPPQPPPDEPYDRAKEYSMTAEVGAIKGPGNKFGRVLLDDAGTGPFDWYPIRWDRDEPDDDCWFELTKPDSRYALRHTKVDGLFGADATEHSTDIPHQFYLKPGADRGILESPVLIYDPASALVVGYLTWPEKVVAGPAFAWVTR
jgi:hypothetical protein